MDDTITLLNAKNRGQTIQPPPQQPDEITNISIISRDESNSEDILDERPVSSVFYLLITLMVITFALWEELYPADPTAIDRLIFMVFNMVGAL